MDTSSTEAAVEPSSLTPYGIIYCVLHIASGRRYIGQTTGDLDKRWAAHVNSSKGRKRVYFTNAIRKHGSDSFIIEEIDRAFSKEELDYLEDYWIRYYHTLDPKQGFNAKSGGHHGKHSKAARRRMSKSQKTSFENGRVHHFLNKKRPQKDIDSMRLSTITYHVKCVETEEVFASSRDAEKKTGISRTSIDRCSKNQRGFAGGFTWIRLPRRSDKEVVEMLNNVSYKTRTARQGIRRRIQCIDTGQIFESAIKAAEFVGLSSSYFLICIKKGNPVKGRRFIILDAPNVFSKKSQSLVYNPS